MDRTKRIFISDIHLSSRERYNAPEESKRARFNPKKHQARLVNFLNKTVLEKEDEIKDLVLVGDIFDDWVCPPDEPPPTFAEIFQSNPEVMGALRAIASSQINLYCLFGNHDHGLKKAEIQLEIPFVIFQKSYDDPQLKLHAEHGNQHVLFNKSHSGIANGRPIGYFITRLTEHLGGYVRRFHDLISYSDDAVEWAAGKSNFFVSMLEALAERAGVNEIVMNSKGRKLSIEKIKNMYEPLAEKYSLFSTIRKLMEEGELERLGDRLSAKKGYEVVIFGHTHKAKIDKDSLFVADRIYANTGCWSQKKAHCVIVDVNADEKATVNLCRVENSGRAVRVEKETI
ncbi:MAG: metallophosphoesterase [Desulfobacterales bacterium]|jgi:UDP-2,3-diacylglucosamine pyrophosphatase LpxH